MKNVAFRRGKEGRNTFYVMRRRKADWFVHTVLKNRLLRLVIEGNKERRERPGRYDMICDIV